jgi:hypothetical protein
MNLRTLSRKYLGWCPGFEEASRFFRGVDIVIPTGFGIRLILFTLLASLGIQKVLQIIWYWFIRVPQGNILPYFISPWKQVADFLLILSSLGFILLGIDTLSTGAFRNRQRKELALILIGLGASRVISSGYLDITLFFSGGLSAGARLFDLSDIVPYVWGGGLLYLGYRILSDTPFIVRETFIAASLMFGIQLIRLSSHLGEVISNLGVDPLDGAGYLLHIIAALGAFTFSLNGIRGGWTAKSLNNRGIPWYLKTGLLSFGIDGLLLVVWVLVDPLLLTEITQNQLSPFIAFSGVLNGLALVAAALLPWHKCREQV